MGFVMLCAAGVGLATVAGSVLSLFIKEVPRKLNGVILSLAAGIMLGATFFSLIWPALMHAEDSVWPCILGLAAGAALIKLMERFVPSIHKLLYAGRDKSPQLDRVLLFLIAIAIHNLPEGMAVGVSFGSGDTTNALSIAIGIALQNIPEGMITILPLLMAGTSRKRALLVALFTGLTEIVGTFVGYIAVTLASAILPFALALAGGTMLYVICHDMIPETHSQGCEDIATYSLIGGVVIMMLIQHFL